MAEVKAKVEEFKGNPVISLPLTDKEDGRRFSFGIRKARAILQYLEDIKKFVEDNDESGESK